MILKFIIRLSALSLGLAYVSCTTPQQHAQLSALNERLNQMISSLYSSPLLSKVQSSEEFPPSSSSQEGSYNYPATPHIVYVAPPGFLEAPQPSDFGYSGYPAPNPVPRSPWNYPYDYYQHQITPVYAQFPRTPYPDTRSAYPQIAAPPPLPSVPFPSPLPPLHFPHSTFHFPYPAPYSPPFTAPAYPPLPIGPSYPLPVPQQPIYSQIPAYPPVSYPPASPFPLPAYAPPLPPYSPAPVPYRPSLPASYPIIQVPFSTAALPQYLPGYPTTPTFPKPIDILPQPQYDYNP